MSQYNYSHKDCSHSAVTHQPYHGLYNQGSTCYLNSVLQVLFMTKDFRDAVERYDCDAKCLDFHLKELFNELKGSTVSTYKLTVELGISRDFVQSDAAECFENILSRVTNPAASQLFQGTLTTKNRCSTCNKETSAENPFWSLPLEMEDCFQEYLVRDGIENYFKESHLNESNQLYCEHCSTKSDTTIKVEMKHHPEVLTLLLKRFKFDYLTMKHVKVTRHVKIPELLQIPPYGNTSPIYQLYAYVEHSGELRSGHYVVTIRAQDDDRWYFFNDHIVSLGYRQPFTRYKDET
ncbi:ubiquitin carboxyl-terminal hydrolase 47 isoform X2 [Fundulus heteroclitus]|uniref:ubiquitin carboxyl-terminal hydrolase 47 isoform X2 n=1 Tax=Fundulus heteroclitus TaxID=8078 RepID=UPI00165C7F76|nr:ubiquitin carboxyl-terminal hydrolase 47 isoform X2 [Fundulus heteroclitus]